MKVFFKKVTLNTRMARIELASLAWKASVMPLDHTRYVNSIS